MKFQKTGTPAPQTEHPQPGKLTLMDFAEVFLTLPEASKREVFGYAKCLYDSASTRAGA